MKSGPSLLTTPVRPLEESAGGQELRNEPTCQEKSNMDSNTKSSEQLKVMKFKSESVEVKDMPALR